jgi:hypothetical protein
MAETSTKEAEVTREERGLFRRMQVTQDFLLVVPFRASDFKPDLFEVNLPATKLLDLVLRDIVIENDHAAVFFRPTSVTMPRLVSETASRTASALMRPRYSREIAAAV